MALSIFWGLSYQRGCQLLFGRFFSAEGVHSGVLHQIKLKMDQKGLKMDQRLKLDERGYNGVFGPENTRYYGKKKSGGKIRQIVFDFLPKRRRVNWQVPHLIKLGREP